MLSRIDLEIVPDPSPYECRRWEQVIAAKDAPIVGSVVNAGANRLLTLNLRHFTDAVAAESGVRKQTPAEFVEQIRSLVISDL